MSCPRGFTRIRYYGLNANRGWNRKLALCRKLIGQPAPEPDRTRIAPGHDAPPRRHRHRAVPALRDRHSGTDHRLQARGAGGNRQVAADPLTVTASAMNVMPDTRHPPRMRPPARSVEAVAHGLRRPPEVPDNSPPGRRITGGKWMPGSPNLLSMPKQGLVEHGHVPSVSAVSGVTFPIAPGCLRAAHLIDFIVRADARTIKAYS